MQVIHLLDGRIMNGSLFAQEILISTFFPKPIVLINTSTL